MTPEVARERYATACHFARWQSDLRYPRFDNPDRWWLLVDAASLALDLANAEASLKRIRGSVAW